MSAGFWHSCALRTSGSVVCWGRNPGGVAGIRSGDPAVTVTKGNPDPSKPKNKKPNTLPDTHHLPESQNRTPRLRPPAATQSHAPTTAGTTHPQQPGGRSPSPSATERSDTVGQTVAHQLASLTGSGAYVTVTRSGTSSRDLQTISNSLRAVDGRLPLRSKPPRTRRWRWVGIAGMGALSAVGALPTPPPPGVPQRLGNARSGRIICSRPYAGSLGVPIAMPVGCTVGYSG